MKLPSLPSPIAGPLPLWPPLLAARGPGARSSAHAHHGVHVVLALEGKLRVRAGGPWRDEAGVVTAPDVPHALDAAGRDVLLVFLDPESDAGHALCSALEGPVRGITPAERDALTRGVDPPALMTEHGAAWTAQLTALLGAPTRARPPRVHPRVRRLLRILRELPPEADTSLSALALQCGLSEGRLMHAFTESIGVPLRPYLAWLKLQRAAAGIVSGAPLAQVASSAGFSDAAHMARTFRRMLGMPPSALRPVTA